MQLQLHVGMQNANHGPKSTSENEQVCLHGEKYIENISISDCLLKYIYIYIYIYWQVKWKETKEADFN